MGEEPCQHIIIIDDSDQIRLALANSIVNFARQSEKSCCLTFSTAAGITNIANPDEKGDVWIGVADSPRAALYLLDRVHAANVTILCDISIPRDTTVGMVGLLERLAHTRMPVNLVFMSSERQNRAIVEPLIAQSKAYFVEKGGPAWDSLAYALINRSRQFAFVCIAPQDFGGMRPRRTQREHATSATIFHRVLALLGSGALWGRGTKVTRKRDKGGFVVGPRPPASIAAEAGKHYPFYEQ